jgi:hypothetical protein
VSGSVIDIVLVLLVVMFAVNGYRQGFLVGLLSFAGFFGGALLGLQIGPLIAEQFDDDPIRVVISLAAVFGLAVAGQALASFVGNRLRSAIVTLVMGAFMHWSIYNLYYMFATRRIRTKRLSESNDTIQLLLNQYDDEGSDWLDEIDEAFRIRNPSARFCNACGLSAKDLDGLSLIELVGAAHEAADLRELLEEGRAFRNVVVPVRVRGEERLRNGQSPVRGIVERALEELDRVRLVGIPLEVQHEARE